MDRLQSTLYRKYGRVAMHVARDLLGRRVGDRIPRVQDYARECETGNGTVQSALRSLTEAGAIGLEARGHQGTFMVAADYRLLRETAGLSSVLGLMPLPYTRRYEGLASGLYDSFAGSDIQFNLGYMRGARNRLAALQRGSCDFVVLSRLAAELAQQQGSLAMVLTLGPQSYVGGHGLLLSDPRSHRGIEDGMRVGVDPNTLDQQWLTQEECKGKRVTLVEISYSRLLDQLRESVVDAAIWNVDELPPDVEVLPLRNETAQMMAERNTEAALVIDAGRPDLERMLPEIIQLPVVRGVQDEVLAGRRIPSY